MVEGINTNENVLSPFHSHPLSQTLCSQIEHQDPTLDEHTSALELCAKDCGVRVAESAHLPQNVF